MRDEACQRREAFCELYRSHLSAIASYAGRRAPAEDAVDVVAETFTVAWRRFEDIPREPSTLPWLYGVARRVLSNQRRGNLRRHGLHQRMCATWIAPVVDDVPPDLTPLRQALDGLSENDREVLLLAGVEELSPAEIAVVLAVAPEVARNRLSRARRRLRAALDEIRTSSTGHGPDEASTEGIPR